MRWKPATPGRRSLFRRNKAGPGLVVAGLLAVMFVAIPIEAIAGQITLAWNPSPGTVAGYIVYYGIAPGIYTSSVDVGNQTTSTIEGLSDGVRYYFVVKAYSSTGLLSAPSNEVDGLTGALLSFTDDPIVPGVHTLKAVHMTELRARIDALRAARGLGPMTWTPLTVGTTMAAASHIAQLRGALDAVYQSLGLPLPIYIDNPLAAGTPIKAMHIIQLRTFVRALE